MMEWLGSGSTMEEIYLGFDGEVPQYGCSACRSCQGELGISLCPVKNRGCCSYFPKFELHEIQKMSKTQEGLALLHNIRKMPGARIYHYYIHVKGYFDEEGYEAFLKSGAGYRYQVEDKSVFFRACPFVKPGKGCSLPVRYRHYVCNLFLCREVKKRADHPDLLLRYTEECDRFARWMKWDNEALEMLLREKGFTLTENFDEVIETLQDIPLACYDFPPLPPIDTESGFPIGA